MTLELSEIVAADPAVLFLVVVVLKATLLMALAAVAAGVLRRASAAVLHRLWALALAALILLPFVSSIMPGWNVPILPATQREGTMRRETAELVRESDPIGEAADVQIASAVPGLVDEYLRSNVSDSAAMREPPVSGEMPAPEQLSKAATDPAPGEDAWNLARTRRVLVIFWAAGFAVVLLPALAGIVANELRRRRARPVVDAAWLNLLAVLRGRLAVGREVRVLESEYDLIPLTWGVLRPVILLPRAARLWPEPMRRMVLLHELTHIKRADIAFQLLGRLAAALYWLHPLAWYALHRLRAECEYACDDCVVFTGERSSDYARQLLDLALSLRTPRVAAALAMARKNKLERRISALFDETRGHTPMRLATKWLAAGIAVTMLLVVAALRSAPAVAEPPHETAALEAAPQKPNDDKAAAGREVPNPVVNKPPAPVPAAPQLLTHPISLAGRALGPDGRPIAGANIYIASCYADWKRLAETETDDEGRYAFRDVPLPIEKANTNQGRDVGAFEVFGQAKGLGFAWRPKKWYYLERRDADALRDKTGDLPDQFAAGDEISLDLKFSPAASLVGRVVDEKGAPITGTTLAIRYCEPSGVTPGHMLFGFSALNQREDVPLEMKFRTTDAEGRFAFADLPQDCLFRIDVRPPGFPSRWVYAATSDEPQPDYQKSPVLTGQLELKFITPLEVPIQVAYGDTGEPAPKVLVQGGNAAASSHLTSDAEGRTVLRLPPGEYRLSLLPARGTPYLVTDENLVVGERAPAAPHVARLRPAGVIEIRVEDQETGEGLPDVDLWREVPAPGGANGPPSRDLLSFRSWEVETRIAHVERPRTDANGRMRALVEPGKHTIGVGLAAYPREYEFTALGVKVECQAGETVEVTFKVRKRAAAQPREDVSQPKEQGALIQQDKFPVTVVGRALDGKGNPIANARIYLASCHVQPGLLAQTVTDAEGRYSFGDVPLPIERQKPPGGRDAGAFQVFGEARGFGFAWRPAKLFYLRPKLSQIDFPRQIDPPDRYEPGDRIELDLRFAPPARISGKITDDRGQPMPGVPVRISYCEPLSARWFYSGNELGALEHKDCAAAQFNLRTTDVQGRFRFEGVPSECRFQLDIEPRGMAGRKVLVATTERPQPDYANRVVRTGELELVFPSPRDVPVRVLLGAGDAPAANVLVQGQGEGASSMATTDSQGRAVLRLPPGNALMAATPPVEMDFFDVVDHFAIPEAGVRDARVLRLRPACVVEATVLDEETGTSVENVEFWQRGESAAPKPETPQPLAYPRWDSKQQMNVHHWEPRTDRKGRARLLLPAGKYQIGIARPPRPGEGHRIETIEQTLQMVECQLGVPARVKFSTKERRPGDVFGAAFIRKRVANAPQKRIDWQSVSVEDALASLSQQYDVEIRIDRAALAAAGISLEKVPPVTLKAPNVTLSSVLDAVLNPAGLGYKIGAEGLAIVPRAESDKGKRTARALDVPTTVDFSDVPLPAALKFLADYHDISIRADAAALKAADISLKDEPPVTLKLAGVSLRSVLKVMLEPWGLEAKLESGELVIVPNAAAAK